MWFLVSAYHKAPKAQVTFQSVPAPVCSLPPFSPPTAPFPSPPTLQFYTRFIFKFLSHIVTFLLLGPGGWHPNLLGLRLRGCPPALTQIGVTIGASTSPQKNHLLTIKQTFLLVLYLYNCTRAPTKSGFCTAGTSEGR